jgi:hypothetical protein
MYDPAVVDAFTDLWASLVADGPALDGQRPGRAPSPSLASSSAPGDTTNELEAALEFGASLQRRLSDGCPWRALTDALCDLPPVNTAAVYVVDEAHQQLIPLRVSGKAARTLEKLAIPMGERISGWVAATGQTVVNADAALDLFDTGATSLRSATAVVCKEGSVRAVVTVYSTGEAAFMPAHRRLIEAGLSLVVAQDAGGVRPLPAAPRLVGMR